MGPLGDTFEMLNQDTRHMRAFLRLWGDAGFAISFISCISLVFSVSFVSGKILLRFTFDSQTMQFSHRRGHRRGWASYTHKKCWIYRFVFDSHAQCNFHKKKGHGADGLTALAKRIGFTLFTFDSGIL